MPDSEFLRKMHGFKSGNVHKADYQQNEAETCSSLVEPYLADVLGWDAREPRMVAQQVQAGFGLGAAAEAVDYALVGDSHRAFIEAKKVGTRLDQPGLLNRLNAYVLGTSDVYFGALTNGIRWQWFYRTAIGGMPERLHPFLDQNVLEPKDTEVPYLEALSRNNRDMGILKRIAEDGVMQLQCEEWLVEIRTNPTENTLRAYIQDQGLKAGKALMTLALEGWPNNWYVSIQTRPSDRAIDAFLRDKRYNLNGAERQRAKRIWPGQERPDTPPQPDGANWEWKWRVGDHDSFVFCRYIPDLILSIARCLLDREVNCHGISDRQNFNGYREVPGHPGKWVQTGMGGDAAINRIRMWKINHLPELQLARNENGDWQPKLE